MKSENEESKFKIIADYIRVIFLLAKLSWFTVMFLLDRLSKMKKMLGYK